MSSFHAAFTALPLDGIAALFFAFGVCLGNFLSHCILQLTPDESPVASNCDRCPWRVRWAMRTPLLGSLGAFGSCRVCGRSVPGWFLLTELATGGLFAGFIVAYLGYGCQSVHEVIPDEPWHYARIFYHLMLISLLIVATGTDLRDYVIPDSITIPGLFVGLLGASLSGQLQTIHLWVNWNLELPGVGPYIPEWIKLHMRLHGLAWSVAGIIAGGGIVWGVRFVSSLVLGKEALGFGDVTLMAMIGSFLGWQPVVFVFLLAPLCGLAITLVVRLMTSRTYVPFGPYLSLAAVVVLFSWKWLWTPTRTIFGHWPSLAILGGVSLGALVLLLGFVRLYRMIPGKPRDLDSGVSLPTTRMNDEQLHQHGDEVGESDAQREPQTSTQQTSES